MLIKNDVYGKLVTVKFFIWHTTTILSVNEGTSYNLVHTQQSDVHAFTFRQNDFKATDLSYKGVFGQFRIRIRGAPVSKWFMN